MDKITNQPEAKNRKGSTEIKIEDKISNMLYEVMEEKDSNESFEWDCGEIDDEFKLSRPSTRHNRFKYEYQQYDSIFGFSFVQQSK